MLKSDETPKPELLDHLAQVRVLSQAIVSAISAIEKNDLQQFENHLAVQETVCNRLADIRKTLSTTAKMNAVAGDDLAGQQLLQQVRQAHVALAQINFVYAALLKRARRSTELIAGLYRSQGEGYDRNPSPLPKRQSWSCEV